MLVLSYSIFLSFYRDGHARLQPLPLHASMCLQSLQKKLILYINKKSENY